MKIILPASNYTYTPSLNRVDFSPMGGSFDSKRLLAIINIKTCKTIYATGSADAGLGGTFAGSVLTYSSSNAGQLATDPLQVFYDDELALQQVAGTVSVNQPVVVEGNTGAAHTVTTAIHDGSGTFPILSTPDPMTGRDGLDVNIQSSSFGGLLNQPLPIPYQNQALSTGFINGGDLVAPKMNLGSNELVVDVTQSGNVPVDLYQAGSPINATNPISVVLSDPLNGTLLDLSNGATGLSTLRTSSNVATNGTELTSTLIGAKQSLDVNVSQSVLPTGASTESTLSAMSAKLPATLGAKPIATAMAVSIASDQIVPVSQSETYITGALTLAVTNNLFTPTTPGPNSTDAQGFKTGSVQLVTAATTGSIIFEHSNDNINFQPMPVFRADSASPNAIVAAFTPVASSFVYHFPIKMRYIRLRIATALNQNAQAFLRLSQESWAPIVPQVVNATAANLNATVAGSLTSVGTVTTVSTVTTATTVGTVTQSNSALPVAVTDVASAALTTTTTTATLTPTGGIAFNVVIPVTATSGTNQTLDVSIEVSDDSGTNWVKVYDFPRITATGVYRSGPLKMLGNRIRYVQTVGGTSPSFTRSIVRLQRSDTIFTRFVGINRTIDPNTPSSTTPAIYCEGASAFNFYARVTAQTTPATIQLQFSDNGSDWVDDIGSTLTTAVGVVHAKSDNEQWRFVRAIVSSAGSGITLGEMVIKGVRE